MKYTITQSRLLYVLSIDDKKHENLLKIGEVFVDNEIADSKDEQKYKETVRGILDTRSYMQGVTYQIVYVECTTYNNKTKCYKADDVYRTLTAMRVSSTTLNRLNKEKVDIWFYCTLAVIQEAIKKVKKKIENGQKVGYGDIKFRPEQEKAIQKTVAHFRKPNGKAFLWNAKMRFGKTLSGLQVAKEMGYKSTLIITHRPVVDDSWHEDFNKIFGNMPEYRYATRMNDNEAEGGNFYTLTQAVNAGNQKLVFFVSMQYLRLSQFVGGKERKLDPLKRDIMEYDWDFVMVDEAHEGIEAAAGVRVMEKLKKENTRILSLSGTPFNLLDKYDEGEIYTWDYVMEQRAKQEWDDQHFGDPNPYAELPRMQILTFTLSKMIRDQIIENNEVFKFHEFFRVWTEGDRIGRFVYEEDVRRFLNKLVEESDTSQYPFSTDEFREHFRHTFWLLPGVKEAAALEKLLKGHEVFGEENDMFHIVNVAGDGNIEDKDGSALKEVQDAINHYEYTITLSCGKLTTGVSVPEWTAVLCMKGSEDTPASSYMQTIFRVQTHAVLDGRQKSDCYVFDFAPDRALTAVAETVKMAVYSQGSGKKLLKLAQKKEEEHLEAFIKLCPVISMDKGEMGRHFTANQIFEKLANVYIERAVRSGYADNSIYNPDQLLNLTAEQEKVLGDVYDLLGSMPNVWKPERININNNGLGDTEGADKMKYIYYLTSENVVPPRPHKSSESDSNGCPTTDDKGWDDKMCAPDRLFPYLFVSNSRLADGQWSDFSEPVLWKEWTDPDTNTNEAKKKRKKENKEKRARMSVLRGVAIRIPLLVYGAEINDEDGEEITIDNFASEEIVDQASWDEFMPRGFTKETFNILKECFDRSIFTGAAKRIRQMVKEADNLVIEDRIAKIATIFSYFHNPDKETVLTPWRVVNMQLSDCLGGWCFYNDGFLNDEDYYTEENQYGENIRMARFVDRGEVTHEIFDNEFARILEINSKTGLYPLYMAYSLFNTLKEKASRDVQQSGERGTNTDSESYYRQAGNDIEIWKAVLQNNIFVICRTKMAVSITKRTLAGFRNDIRMNVRCYEKEVAVNDLISAGIIKKDAAGITNDKNTYYYNYASKVNCDMITVLRAKPVLFQADVVKGNDYWHVDNSIPLKEEDINNMKFKAIVGNPPYQIMDEGNGASDAAAPIYNKFVETSELISPNYLSMIMPSKWMVGGRSELSSFLERMKEDTHLSYMKDFRNDRSIFPSAHNDGGICYFLWDAKKTSSGIDYNHVTMKGEIVHSDTIKNHFTTYIIRDTRVIPILKKIFPTKESLNSDNRFAAIVSKTRPFGLRKDIFNSPENYPNSEMSSMPFSGSVKIYGVKGKKGGAKRTEGYITEKIISDKYNAVEKYKIFFTTTYSSDAVIPPDIIRGYKRDACTETFLLIGPFDTKTEMENCAAYMESKFFRFLLFFGHGTMQVNQCVFNLIPIQDFSKKITDKDLYKKYRLDDTEQKYIETLINPTE